MLLHRVDRGDDVVRLVADDLHLPALGQLLLHLGRSLLEPLDDFDGVRPRLLADVQHDRRLAVDGRDRLRLGHAVLDVRDVADLHR